VAGVNAAFGPDVDRRDTEYVVIAKAGRLLVTLKEKTAVPVLVVRRSMNTVTEMRREVTNRLANHV